MDKRKAPLRKIIGIEQTGYDAGMMSQDRYKLECGHIIWASSKTTYRARCWKCQQGIAPPQEKE